MQDAHKGNWRVGIGRNCRNSLDPAQFPCKPETSLINRAIKLKEQKTEKVHAKDNKERCPCGSGQSLCVIKKRKRKKNFLTPRQLSNRSDLPIFHFKNRQIPLKFHVFWLKFYSAKKTHKKLAVLQFSGYQFVLGEVIGLDLFSFKIVVSSEKWKYLLTAG